MLTLSSIVLLTSASAFKMEICHNENNNPVTIEVAVPSGIAHIILHGDSVGRDQR